MKPIAPEFNVPQPLPRALWFVPGLVGSLAIAFAVLAWRTQREHAAIELRQLERQRQIAEVVQERAARAPLVDVGMQEYLASRRGPWAVMTAWETVGCPSVGLMVIDYAAAPLEASAEVEFVELASLNRCVDRLNEGLNDGDVGWRWHVREIRTVGTKSAAHLEARFSVAAR